MENKYYYGFEIIFDFNSVDINIFNSSIEYLDIGFTYLGYIVINSIYRDLGCKFKIDIKDTVNLLITEFDRLLKVDEVFKYIKLDYDIMYKELENIIKDKIKLYSELVEEI